MGNSIDLCCESGITEAMRECMVFEDTLDCSRNPIFYTKLWPLSLHQGIARLRTKMYNNSYDTRLLPTGIETITATLVVLVRFASIVNSPKTADDYSMPAHFQLQIHGTDVTIQPIGIS